VLETVADRDVAESHLLRHPGMDFEQIMLAHPDSPPNTLFLIIDC